MSGSAATRRLARPQSELSLWLRWALVMAAAALTAGAILIPEGDELLLIHVKNHDVDRARQVLADGRGQGLSSAASAIAHGELYLFEGRVDEAIGEMEAYAAARPGDEAAWVRLAGLYANAQRTNDRQRALAHVYDLAPTEARARELAAMYRRAGDEAAEARVLRDLAERGHAQPEELLRSARLEAAFGRPDRARTTLEQLRRLDSPNFDYPAIELYASLLADAGQASKLARALQPLPLVREQPHLLVDLAHAFKKWGNVDASLAVLMPLPGVPSTPDWLAALARLATGTTQAGRVVAELTAIDAAHQLPAEPLDALVALALTMPGDEAVDRILSHRPGDLAPPLVARIVGHAVTAGNRDRAQSLVARYGDVGLSESPILALDLAAGRGDTAAAGRWIAFIDSTATATPEEVAAVAKIESGLGWESRAFDRLTALAATGLAPDWALTDLVTAAQRLGRGGETLARLTPLATTSAGARGAWARLAAAMKRTDLIARWFDSTTPGGADAAALRDVYYALSDQGARDLATEAARRVFAMTRRADDALRYGEALLASGRPSDALACLRPVRGQSADTEAAYDTALHAALAAGLDVADELRLVFAARLREASLPDARRPMLVEGLWLAGERASLHDEILRLAGHDLPRWLSPLVETARATGNREPAVALVASALDAAPGRASNASPDEREALMHALLDLGAPDVAVLPHLRRLAAEKGGSWTYAYDERLAQTGRTADRIALWTAVGQSPDSTADARRGAASRLHELGESHAAAALMQRLAAAAAPADPDVEALIFYWGPRPTTEQRAWLVARLRTAPPGDQPAWIQRLVAAGGSRDVVDALAVLPTPASPAFTQAWLDAHRATADRQLVRSSLEAVLDRTGMDAASLRHAARIALGEGLTGLAARAFRAVAAAHPDDLEALRWIGVLAFYDGRMGEARTWLAAYDLAGGRDPEPLYQLGELSRAGRDDARARQYFARALVELSGPAAAEANPGLRPNVLVRLGRRQQAIDAFDALLAARPDLDHVRADYAAALLEWGDTDRAGLVLISAPTRSPAAAPGRPAAETPGPLTDDGGRKRLDLLLVQWLTYGGQYRQALQILETLGERYPADADVLVARGRFDAERGRAGAADRAFEAARLQAPARDDIATLVAERARAAAPRARAVNEGRSVRGAWSERSTTAAFFAALSPHRDFTLTIERVQLNAARLPLADGQTHAIDVARQRFEATLTTPVANGTTLKAAVFGASGHAGAGAALVRHDLHGSSNVVIEFGKPYWEFPESIVDAGSRDRVGFERQLRLGAETSAWVLANWNRYRLASGPALSSGGVTVGVVRMVRRENPTLSLQYGFDLERTYRTTMVTTADGLAYSPIPVPNREVHVAGAIGRFPAALWDAEVAAGYTIDRLGGRGPFFSAHLTPKPTARAGVELWAERRLYALATTQQELRAGVSLTVRFGK